MTIGGDVLGGTANASGLISANGNIGPINIRGDLVGTSGTSGDHFGFVAQQIGALKIGGTKIPLLAGNGNDTDATLSRYIISASRDFTVHEVA